VSALGCWRVGPLRSAHVGAGADERLGKVFGLDVLGPAVQAKLRNAAPNDPGLGLAAQLMLEYATG
jgi:hypothetical protein